MITVNIHGWEFRMLRDGTVESRSAEKRDEWKARGPRETNMVDDHYNFISNIILQAHDAFPPEDFVMPVSEPVREEVVNFSEAL